MSAKPGLVRVVYMTAPDAETARHLGRALVEEGLAACVNVLGSAWSIYQWEGKLEEAEEVVMLAKVGADALEACIRRVVELHPYDCPCVVHWPLGGGHPDFLAWVLG